MLSVSAFRHAAACGKTAAITPIWYPMSGRTGKVHRDSLRPGGQEKTRAHRRARVLSHSLDVAFRLLRSPSILAELDGQTGKQQQDQGNQPPLGNGGDVAWLFRRAVRRTVAAILTAQFVAHAVATAWSAIARAATTRLTGARGTAVVAALVAILWTVTARFAGRVASAVTAARLAHSANGTALTIFAPTIVGTGYAVLATLLELASDWAQKGQRR